MPLTGGQAEALTIPPECTISDDELFPAAADASGRILFEVDSADSWYEHVAVVDTSRKTFAVIATRFSGDVWMPGAGERRTDFIMAAKIDKTLSRMRLPRKSLQAQRKQFTWFDRSARTKLWLLEVGPVQHAEVGISHNESEAARAPGSHRISEGT